MSYLSRKAGGYIFRELGAKGCGMLVCVIAVLFGVFALIVPKAFTNKESDGIMGIFCAIIRIFPESKQEIFVKIIGIIFIVGGSALTLSLYGNIQKEKKAKEFATQIAEKLDKTLPQNYSFYLQDNDTLIIFEENRKISFPYKLEALYSKTPDEVVNLIVTDTNNVANQAPKQPPPEQVQQPIEQQPLFPQTQQVQVQSTPIPQSQQQDSSYIQDVEKNVQQVQSQMAQVFNDQPVQQQQNQPAPQQQSPANELARADQLLVESKSKWDNKDYNAAVESARQAYEIRKKLLGENNPKTVEVANMLNTAQTYLKSIRK